MDENLIPAIVTPPGELIKDELDERGWNQKHLAEVMGSPTSTVARLIAGNVEITEEIADQLERALEISAGFWLRIQGEYGAWLARTGGQSQTDSTLLPISHST